MIPRVRMVRKPARWRMSKRTVDSLQSVRLDLRRREPASVRWAQGQEAGWLHTQTGTRGSVGLADWCLARRSLVPNGQLDVPDRQSVHLTA